MSSHSLPSHLVPAKKIKRSDLLHRRPPKTNTKRRTPSPSRALTTYTINALRLASQGRSEPMSCFPNSPRPQTRVFHVATPVLRPGLAAAPAGAAAGRLSCDGQTENDIAPRPHLTPLARSTHTHTRVHRCHRPYVQKCTPVCRVVIAGKKETKSEISPLDGRLVFSYRYSSFS